MFQRLGRRSPAWANHATRITPQAKRSSDTTSQETATIALACQAESPPLRRTRALVSSFVSIEVPWPRTDGAALPSYFHVELVPAASLDALRR